MTIKNIFFDFDGVVAESVSAKTDAFREMYLPYGKSIADEVVDYHINNGGVSRYEKFKYWEKKFFDKELSDLEVEKLANRFSELVLNKVVESEEVKGCKSFLENYHQKMNFWVITGTPTKEIRIIVAKRNLDKYFIELCGSPENKKYWTEYLIEKHNLNREETLFLGDATTDKDAAEYSKLKFALRLNEENKEIFKDFSGFRFNDFEELERSLIEKNMI
ncbi:HAD hydrolase-like protein [Croceivirga thetidis]|uniref:phosphoglycolate phosphatase n=1 Tax=Croceivirga thetidis TaxID=2721623 RepID=A0ABX1GNH9_9FLAO|nr:HAD hydrolase-like protein [Croceivirga thetidis]